MTLLKTSKCIKLYQLRGLAEGYHMHSHKKSDACMGPYANDCLALGPKDQLGHTFVLLRDLINYGFFEIFRTNMASRPLEVSIHENCHQNLLRQCCLLTLYMLLS